MLRFLTQTQEIKSFPTCLLCNPDYLLDTDDLATWIFFLRTSGGPAGCITLQVMIVHVFYLYLIDKTIFYRTKLDRIFKKPF